MPHRPVPTMNLGHIAQRVQRGETVSFVAFGGSMTPRIQNGERVTVVPRVNDPQKGDVVLARVNGRWYLHKVTAVNGKRVQISNNHGRVNGWTQVAKVVGVLAPPVIVL